MLLDEPFASLDAHMRASVRADVQQICRAAGTTAILVTHDQDEALSMADRIAVLRDGTIVQYAAPEDLYTRPADPALARFVGDANLLDGQLAAGNAAVSRTRRGHDPWQAAARAGQHRAAGEAGRVTVLIRPEQLEILAEMPGIAGSSQPGCLAGRVVACEYYGHDAVVRVQPDGDLGGHEVIVRTSGGPLLPAGSPVLVRARGAVLAWTAAS